MQTKLYAKITKQTQFQSTQTSRSKSFQWISSNLKASFVKAQKNTKLTFLNFRKRLSNEFESAIFKKRLFQQLKTFSTFISYIAKKQKAFSTFISHIAKKLKAFSAFISHIAKKQKTFSTFINHIAEKLKTSSTSVKKSKITSTTFKRQTKSMKTVSRFVFDVKISFKKKTFENQSRAIIVRKFIFKSFVISNAINQINHNSKFTVTVIKNSFLNDKSEKQTWIELKLHARKQYLCIFNNQELNVSIKRVYSDMQNIHSIYRVVIKKMRQLYKNWKSNVFVCVIHFIDRYLKSDERLFMKKIKNFKILKRFLMKNFEMHWVESIFRFVNAKINIDDCFVIEQIWFKRMHLCFFFRLKI